MTFSWAEVLRLGAGWEDALKETGDRSSLCSSEPGSSCTLKTCFRPGGTGTPGLPAAGRDQPCRNPAADEFGSVTRCTTRPGTSPLLSRTLGHVRGVRGSIPGTTANVCHARRRSVTLFFIRVRMGAWLSIPVRTDMSRYCRGFTPGKSAGSR
ncbi:hypothetical protein VUR80DRAFT_2966 [Thermomyces stellatus]